MTWTRIDLSNEATWPPQHETVLVQGEYLFGLRQRVTIPNEMIVDAEPPIVPPFAFYDDHNDLDEDLLDVMEDAVNNGIPLELEWHPLPEGTREGGFLS